MIQRIMALVLALALFPQSAVAQEEQSFTPKVLVVGAAALGGLSLFFGLEAQLAGSHEADPSTAREGLATAFTVVSISALALAVASLAVSVVMVLPSGDDRRASIDLHSPPLRIACPQLSCLPEVVR